MTLQGASQLRSRLNAIADAGSDVAEQWADESVRGIQGEIPKVTGKTAASVHAEDVSNDGARVVGSPVVGYLSGGTAAHDEVPRNAQALRFKIGAQTIFSKRVHHPATRGNPRILQQAADALHGFADAVYRRWNGAA